MKIERLPIVLTVVNLALLVFLLGRAAVPVAAGDEPPMLRGSGLQIVDSQGRIRASLGVLPPSTATDGKPSGETVLFRLINADGQPSVKIATGPAVAGLSFVGGDDQSYIILQADRADAALKMVEPDGREQTITP